MLSIELNGVAMRFETSPALFSPQGLDAGTRAMLERARFGPEDKLLDLGCGWGFVGVYAAKCAGEERVTMADIDPEAVRLAKENAARNGVPGVRVLQSDGFQGIDDAGYTLILSNPPYHADFSVAKRFIEKGFNRLALGGRLMMVTKRRPWYQNKLTAIFGGVSVAEAGGYFIFTAEKRRATYANRG
jgi:16S rRNA (guanine1207-N2)-methyltransferase